MKLTIGQICELYNSGVETILHDGEIQFRKMTQSELLNKEFEYENIENIENNKIRLNVIK